MITDKEQIKQFLEDFETNPQNAYERLSQENKIDWRPQLIPLTSRDNNGRYIPETVRTFKHWRKLIFNSKNNYKKFAVLDYQGNSYITTLSYIHCNTDIINHIISNKWYLSMDSQSLLIEEIKKNSQNFEAHIVQKKDKSKNSWLMLHVEKR